VDIFTIAIGITMILYGTFTLIMREKKPEAFGKIQAMQNRYGEKSGRIIHIIAYSIAPIIMGLVFCVAGLLGRSLF